MSYPPELSAINDPTRVLLAAKGFGSVVSRIAAGDTDVASEKHYLRLHVRDNFWGGTVAAAEHRYGQLIVKDSHAAVDQQAGGQE